MRRTPAGFPRFPLWQGVVAFALLLLAAVFVAVPAAAPGVLPDISAGWFVGAFIAFSLTVNVVNLLAAGRPAPAPVDPANLGAGSWLTLTQLGPYLQQARDGGTLRPRWRALLRSRSQAAAYGRLCDVLDLDPDGLAAARAAVEVVARDSREPQCVQDWNPGLGGEDLAAADMWRHSAAPLTGREYVMAALCRDRGGQFTPFVLPGADLDALGGHLVPAEASLTNWQVRNVCVVPSKAGYPALTVGDVNRPRLVGRGGLVGDPLRPRSFAQFPFSSPHLLTVLHGQSASALDVTVFTAELVLPVGPGGGTRVYTSDATWAQSVLTADVHARVAALPPCQLLVTGTHIAVLLPRWLEPEELAAVESALLAVGDAVAGTLPPFHR